MKELKKLVAAPLISSLRGSIVFAPAATAAEGVSADRVYHAYRGAENFVNKLKKIGVKIKVLKMSKYLAKIIAVDQEGLSNDFSYVVQEQKY